MLQGLSVYPEKYSEAEGKLFRKSTLFHSKNPHPKHSKSETQVSFVSFVTAQHICVGYIESQFPRKRCQQINWAGIPK